MTRGRRRRLLAALVLPVAALPAVLGGGPASAGPALPAAAPAPSAQSLDELRLRESELAGDLEDSTAAVRAAGARLAEVEAQLPAAERAASDARGELAGAQAKAAAAAAAVRRAEAALAAARSRVDAATEQVREGRLDVDRLARRSYQHGSLSGLRDVLDATDPADVLERTSLLKAVFQHQDATLGRLTQDRLALASVSAGLAAEERALEAAKAEALAEEQRAEAAAAAAEAARQRVAELAAERRAVLQSAEASRAEDLREYQAAQAASRALAERIRKAAEEAARRLAAERAAAERAAAEARAKAAAAAAAAKAKGQPAPPPAAAPQTGGMLWPANGRLTSRYGNRRHPIFGDVRFHAGIDIGAPIGTAVRASDLGIVTFAGRASGYGTLVVVSHGTRDGRDLSTAYAHLSSFAVREGQRVSRGQSVGRVGNEGNSTGPHLHFEVRRNGDPVDPLRYVSPP